MADVDSLPPDQRAALQLLLKQGQTYEQIADLLGIEPAGVRQRAHAALASLGPGIGERLEDDRRAEVSDYLLGQQSVSEREGTRAVLDESASARAWAQGVADELEPLAGDALPEIPGANGEPLDELEPEPEPEPEPEGAAEPAGYARAERDRAPGSASRLGGALLLGGIGVVIAVVLIILLSGGDDNDSANSRSDVSSISSTTPTGTTTTGANGQQVKPLAQINLTAPQGGDRTLGIVQVFASGADRAIIARGQGLEPGAYALWLYNSGDDAQLLGFVPNRVGQDGAFQTQGVLPKNARNYKQIVVTKENVTRTTRTAPKQPGEVALQGDLKLG